MCIAIKSSRPLNPRAQEWVPPHKTLLPPLLPPPHLLYFIPYSAPYLRPPYTFPVDMPAGQNWKENIPVWRGLSGRKFVPRMRSEWRPRKSVGGAAAHSPPRGSVKLASSSKTTVMIKNLPNQLSRDLMLGFLDSYCQSHSLEYDFFYLPMDFSNENNLGYAFVNLTTVRCAIKLKKLLQNYEWGVVTTEKGTYTSKKICDVKWATTQGKEGQIKRFRNSVFACDNPEFLPVVFDPPRNGSNCDVARPITIGALRQAFKSST